MFSRKKFTKSEKVRNVIFDGSGSHDENIRFDVNVPSGSSLECYKDVCQEEMERIVTPYDRFEWLLDSEEGKPEVFVPVDTHHYDEEDYRDHRHRTYPHVHQPLRSMEPRLLMKIKTKIKANKRAEDKAAKAVIQCGIPALKTTDVDSHVLIDTGKEISSPIISIALPRRKKRRKRKRSKKHESFQPTLCKLSEESSSPLHSAITDEYEDASIGGLVLEELSEAMRPIHENVHSLPALASSQSSSAVTLSFLDEIASVDLPIGFLDMTHQCYAARQYSLPFLDNMDRIDIADNVSSSQGFVDFKRSSNNKHLKFVLPGDHCETEQSPLISSDVAQTDTVDYLKCGGGSPVVISPITHSHGDLNDVNLTQVASTSAITSELALKISNCNFQVGSVDSVAMSMQNIFTGDEMKGYNKGASEPVPLLDIDADVAVVAPSSYHHFHHHHKEHYNKRDLEKRTFSGQDMRSLWQSKDTEEVDEYESTLGDAIIDDMRNHRCYEMPALNRTRIRNRYVHSNRRALHRSRSVSHSRTDDKYQECHDKLQKCTTCSDDACKSNQYTKSQQDLIFQSNGCPLEWNCNDSTEDNLLPLFVEMDILKPHKYWREISRWICYEQRYNELSDTFGRAHSSPLKFTAFTQFRVQLEDAIFMPNVEVKTFEEAINQLTEELLVAQLFSEPRDSFFVKDVFKWKHFHAGEKVTNENEESGTQVACESTINLQQSYNSDCNMRLINTSPGNINNAVSGHSFNAGTTKISFDHGATKSIEPSLNAKFGVHSNYSSMIKMLRNSIPILRHAKHPKSDLEGHLPQNTEGVSVQVGALESLKKPFLAILRFKQTILMDRVTELNLPIRFLIVCLGPPAKVQYEELGRVISSMLINKEFCKLMYRATDKCEIIEGLYKYLDTCFVLSYAGPRPTKNIHSMADHIHDFVRVETNPSPFHSNSKENEGIKHSASVDRTYEQRSQIIRRGDSVRFDPDLSGDNNRRTKSIYEHSEPDIESGKDLSLEIRSDVYHVNFKSKQKGNSDSASLRKQSPVQVQMCCNIAFFLFRLLRLDIVKYKNRFLSDFKDAFLKDNIVIVLCGLMYLYFVCLSPALTFGVLLGDLVSKEFNVQMVLICTGLLTIVFALIGGNPLLVIGITGPMFLMETVIAKMASSFNLQIMLYRFVIAVYVSIIGFVSVAFNITWVMQMVRRSVEECFNGFVGLYFIFKAGLTIIRIFTNSKSIVLERVNVTIVAEPEFDNQIAVGFASLVLAYSMYQICMVLNSVNRGRFFTRKFRKMMDYFNVAIGILVLSLINIVIFNILGIRLPTLKADTINSVWFKIIVDALQWHSVSLAAHTVAFMLAFALMSLIFTETAISGITVTKIEKKLVKSSLFAQDQFLCLCVIPVICGLLGWPFLSGAAVRSTSHVIAMTKWDQKVIPGVKHKILGVVEQRVTMIIVGALILATVSIESVLGYVPTAAMLGMFFYMGVMGIRDLVVTRRLIAMFKRRKHWKDHEYLRDIPPSVLKTFEILQLGLIAVMFSMNCITEFAGISWTSFLIPGILLSYALCRESVLPRCQWFTAHLDKLDPRHYVLMAPLCRSQELDYHSSSDKQQQQQQLPPPFFSNRPSSVSSAILGSSIVVNTTDTRFDFEDGTNTSGDDISSSSDGDGS